MNEKSPSVSQEDHERALNLLVFEYLRKKKFVSSSASFSVEAQVVQKPEQDNDSHSSFLSDWFQALYKMLQLTKGSQLPPDSEIKRFIESSKHLFDSHKISSLSSNSSLGSQNSGAPPPGSSKTDGFSGKFGNQGRRDSDEPPSKLHAGLTNGKPPATSGPGAKQLQASSGVNSNGVSIPTMYGQPSGNPQLRPQFNLNLSLPSHSAGTLANWPGPQNFASSNPPNPMQQNDGTMPPQQTMPFSLNGHLPGGGPPNGMPGQNSDPHVMSAMQNASPAGLKGSMANQQFMSPQQMMAQQQSQQQRHILFQQNQRYLLQQQMLAGGIMNPSMGYMNHNAMVAIGANNSVRGMPIYQQREVYAQHHKQVQMLKLQQHNARQQLMLSRQSGAPGQNMGRPAGDTPEQNGSMSHLNFPGNHPGAAQNPLVMQQMMNMSAMANFNGGSSAPHHPMPNNGGNPFSGANPHMNTGGPMTPNALGNGGTSTPSSVNFEALFASMQSNGSAMNGGMNHSQPPGASSVNAGGGSDQGKNSTSEEESAKMFGKFVEADLFNLSDNTGNSNSQGMGGGNGTGGQLGDQGNNMDMYSLDPFSQTEFFS